MTTDSCIRGENMRRVGYQNHPICESCMDCPVHPVNDPDWVTEMEERGGRRYVEELMKESFREELYRQLAESPRRKAK